MRELEVPPNQNNNLDIVLSIATGLYQAENFKDIGKVLFDNYSEFDFPGEMGIKFIIYNKENDNFLKIIDGGVESGNIYLENDESLKYFKFEELGKFSSYAITHKSSLVIQDSTSDFAKSISPETPIKTAIAMVFIPLYYKKDLVGVISFSRTPINSISDEFINYLESTSKLVSIKVGQLMEEKARSINEKLLAEQKEMLQKVLEALPIGVWFADKYGEFIYSNRMGKKIWEAPLNYVPSDYHHFKRWKADTGEEVDSKDWALSRAISRGEETRSDIVEIECFDKTRKIISNTGFPTRNENGEITGAIIINEDVTEKQKAEKKIKLEEERTESLLKLYQMLGENGSTICEFALDESLKLTASQFGFIAFADEINKKIRIHTWSKGIRKMGHSQMKAEYELDNNVLWMEPYRQKKTILINDYNNSHNKTGLPEGHIPIYKYLGVPIFDMDNLVMFIGVCNKKNDYDDFDVRHISLIQTELWNILKAKRTEKSLIESQNLYSDLVENVRDWIWELDAEGIFTFSNKRVLDYLGYKVEEIIGHNLNEFIPLKLSEGYEELGFLKQNVNIVSHEIEFRHKNGQAIIFEMNAQQYFNNENSLIGYRGINRNITDRKKFDREFIKFEKMESLSLLAGGIAHDFNNILTAILGNISLAKMKIGREKEERLKEILQNAEKASMKAKDLTYQLLTFSKGGVPVVKPSSIGSILKDTTIFSLSGSGVKYDFFISEDLWVVEIDPGQISQLIQNLVINANQAMPKGGFISIFADNVFPDNDTKKLLSLKQDKYVRVIIKDTGTGISKETIAKIFDPYFTTKKEGNGLGLSIVYSIIRNHHGNITVESEPNIGTIFTFYIPASQNNIEEQEEKSKKFYYGHGKILIMDDDDMIRELLSEILTNLGYQVVTSMDGNEAVEKFESAVHDFDIVLMDLTVPGGIGGKDAVKILKELKPELKCIVSSGYSNDPIMSNYQDYGFDAVIRKPFTVEQITYALHQILSRE